MSDYDIAPGVAAALDEVLAGIRGGVCTELFACGTAAIVSQERRAPDPFGWTREVV